MIKLSKVALAVAAVSGTLVASTAMAQVTPVPATADKYSNTGEFAGNTLNIRISGATAQDGGILGMAVSLCKTGTMTAYATNGTNTAITLTTLPSNVVYFCEPDIGTNPGQLSSAQGRTYVAIYKYSPGGSAFGVVPIASDNATSGAALGADGNQLPFLDMSEIAKTTSSCLTAGIKTVQPYGSLGTYTSVVCPSAPTKLATTYIGLSDVEPAFFMNATTAQSKITTSQASALLFAPRVTKNVYDRLQVLQGLTTPTCGATLDSAGCVPSLSSAQLTTLFTQAGQAWSSIGVTGLADDAVYVARRVDSSGTQKLFEAHVARTPNGQPFKSCNGGDVFVAPDSGDTTVGDSDTWCSTGNPGLGGAIPTVFAGNGDGNVRNCLTNHQTAGRSAIGIGSTEANPNGSWRYVRIDGILPTYAGLASGNYRAYSETAINTRKTGPFATAAQLGYTVFVNRLSSDLANKNIVSLLVPAKSFGPTGLMALISRQTTAPDNIADFTGANAITPWSKLVGGSTLDNCSAPHL